MKRLYLFTVSVALGLGAACGGSPTIPGVTPSRESGQSSLMGETFAGANKCNPANHERPFIIEWDATDMSSFEARAANDVVIVKYVGCDLKILDSCNDEQARGSLGAYKPPEWTAGSLEKIDIASEGELFAKLPLGAATLGGRVQGGEKFSMEYYVSGTRTSTRPAVYKADIAKNPGCRGATHFVYGYNLGAFALGSVKNLETSADVSLWGFGGGGKMGKKNNAEKKGGDLASCKGESAREVASCKMPIRLTLRPIEDGENPDVQAAKAPETPAAANLAGKVDAKIDMDDKSRAYYDAALQRFRARDGKACLTSLDQRDKSDRNAENLSTRPTSPIAMLRAQCVMLSGQCDAGKQQMRKAWQAQQGSSMGDEQIDNVVSSMAGQFCQGGSMSERDQLLAAAQTLMQGGTMKKTDPATCAKAWDNVKRLGKTVKPKDDDDALVKSATTMHLQGNYAAMCLGKAGDCNAAFKAYHDAYVDQMTPHYKDKPEILKEITKPEKIRPNFENIVSSCKGK